MAYKLEKRLGRNYSSRSRYGHGSEIKGITIHHWGSTGQKHANVVAWLRGDTGNRGSSAHYVVSDGLVTQIVDESNAAWHAGNNQGNGTTIGIECRPEMTAGDWATLVELCADIERRRGSMKYYRHKDWKNTACPGKYSSRLGELVDAVNAALKGKPPAKPKPPKKSSSAGDPFPLDDGHFYYTEDRRSTVHSGYWPKDRPAIRKIQRKVGAAVDGRFGKYTKNKVIRWQRKHGVKDDGAVGSVTWGAMF